MKLYHVYDTITEKKTALYSTPKSAKEDAQFQNFYTGSDVVETTIKGSTDMFATLFKLLNDKSIHSVKGKEVKISKLFNPFKYPRYEFKKDAENEEQRSENNLLSPSSIRRLREAKGVSQNRFAKTLGIPQNSLNRYEHGILVQTKSTDNLFRIIEKFPETYDFLERTKNI
jgi:DNA-binding transcriptional regulator YiaG